MNSLLTVFIVLTGLVAVNSQGLCDNVRCTNGYCAINSLGQAVCQCEPGYKAIAPNVCSDIDECVEYDFLCDGFPGCCNTLGSFYCYPCARRHQSIPFRFYRFDA